MISGNTSRNVDDTDRKAKNTSRRSNKEKIYEFLLKQDKVLTTTEISNGTEIDIKNISRYLKTLESEGLIIRNTVQEGKRRLVYVKLKDGQNKEIITSRKSDTGRSKNKSDTSRIEKEIDLGNSEGKDIKETKSTQFDSTGRSKNKSDTSRKSDTGRIEKDNISFPEDQEIKNSEFTIQEKGDLATAVLNWIQGYRINVVRNPNGKQAILEMPRMLSLYKKLSEVEYKETKNDDFKEYLSKIKDNKDINHEDD
ncbi:hypothetical protein LCGC14_2658200 [marine sediment metagenome]|uniref:Uncharacterized protein n=1 Tax=marine sediment metagenome TaxID=412755 RepID=A0A0F9C371_9ZZZZ